VSALSLQKWKRMKSKHRRVNIITHVHTDASTGETSELDEFISGEIRWMDGEDSPIEWAECFTPIERLEKVLSAPDGPHGPVHMVVVTDHMRAASHSLPDRNLAAAARNHRIALGAELATRTRDADGKYRIGPEILTYGDQNLQNGPHGPYYGLSQDLLDELYETCRDDEGFELCTRRTQAALRKKGIAHGLSHPLDGHELSLEGTLAIISEFDFIETINGGFTADSARTLETYIELNNALVRGAVLPDRVLTERGRRIVARIRESGRILHALAGSDAHSHDFARALTGMTPDSGQEPNDVNPGQFFAKMLRLADEDNSRPESPLATMGKCVTNFALVSDVVAIVMRNILLNLKHRKNPLVWATILPNTFFKTRGELRRRSDIQKRRLQQIEEDFDPVRLLPYLRPPVQRIDEELPGVDAALPESPATTAEPVDLLLN